MELSHVSLRQLHDELRGVWSRSKICAHVERSTNSTVHIHKYELPAVLLTQALYFDRYTRLLAPDLDPLRDDRVTLPSGEFRGNASEQR